LTILKIRRIDSFLISYLDNILSRACLKLTFLAQSVKLKQDLKSIKPIMNIRLLFTLMFFLCSYILQAQVVINEYSASNLNQFIDNNEKYEDWVELYNTSSSETNIGGWFLSDKEDNPLKWEIPTGTTIPANGYLVFWCSSRDGEVLGELHTSFKITQTKDNEYLVLSTPSGTIASSTPVELTLLGNSRCLDVDGGTDWMVTESPTFGTTNDNATQYLGYTAAPTIDLAAGFYSGAQTVTIENNEPNSVLHYTLDGTLPTTSSPVYAGAITVNETQVVKARSYSMDVDILPGKIDFNTYFINETFTLPVFSVAADGVQDLANGQGELRPIGSIEYFVDEEREAIGYGDLNRHGQDSWILPHRSLDWVTRDEMGYTATVKAKLFNYSERDDHQRIMLRASGDDNYPANDDADHVGSCHVRDEYVHTLSQNGDMKLDVRAVERVVVFLDGQYWGVYGMRERPVDHDYTKYYYDQGKYDLHYLTTWGDTEAEYGGDEAFAEWGELRDFALNNDLGIDANYQYVKDNLQLTSLIDYMLLNLNTVSSDWLNYNTGWWQGTDPDGDHKKWGYIMWDNDASFDYYINYSGVPDISPYAEPCDIEDISDYMDEFFSSYWGGGPDVGKHEKIFLKLQEENEDFRQLYYSRSADLMNTVFSCDNMLNTLDSMIAIIAPEMPRQIARWGGTMEEWESNVQEMRDFISIRCTQLDEGLITCFDLEGPYNLTLLIEPAGVGEIELNTLTNIENFPWTGEYFGNMENLIEANSKNDNFGFLEWESTSGNLINDLYDDNTAITLTQDDTLIAHFSTSVSTYDLDDVMSLSVYPTLARDFINVDFSLTETTDLTFELYSMLGERVTSFYEMNDTYPQGDHAHRLDISNLNLPAGMYLLNISKGNASKTVKISVIE
jgi:hypothetical protein